MFNNLFGKNMPKMPEVDPPKDIKEMPRPPAARGPRPKTEPDNEHFRVGYTTDGYVTLTIMSTDGFSQTLSMTPNACERLIRMLRAAYAEGIDNEAAE